MWDFSLANISSLHKLCQCFNLHAVYIYDININEDSPDGYGKVTDLFSGFIRIQKIGVRAEAEPLKKSFDFFQCTTILAPCRYTSTITCYSLCVVFFCETFCFTALAIFENVVYKYIRR